jgi:WD40 repeat protein
MGCGVWDSEGRQIHNFCEDGSKLRANDLAISPDGRRLVVLSESSIVVFDFTSYEKIIDWQLDDVKLTSVTISQDSRHMLISMNPDKIKLMEIDTGEVIQRFEAHQQREFIIRSVFGGADENFVVSGSEGEPRNIPCTPRVSQADTHIQTREYTSGVPTASSSKPSTPTSAA